jgi:hypothetical protein
MQSNKAIRACWREAKRPSGIASSLAVAHHGVVAAAAGAAHADLNVLARQQFLVVTAGILADTSFLYSIVRSLWKEEFKYELIVARAPRRVAPMMIRV